MNPNYPPLTVKPTVPIYANHVPEVINTSSKPEVVRK